MANVKLEGYKLALADGTEAKLVYNFGLIRAIRKRHAAAENTIRMLGSGKQPGMDEIYEFLYTCYLCGCEYDHAEPMGEDDFYFLAGSDMTGAMLAFRELYDPNGKASGARRS